MKTLAIKYRPKTFDDVEEQDAIKFILQEQIANKSFKNCYLFTGGAGTGKTTTARIFADVLNSGKGNTIEIDGASNNGVDNVREIIDNAKFKSLDSDYKIYIIDECHMISNGGWNAMLKLIEEPPASTIFIFCTTDPQKIPNTILSRVQRYDFQRITFNTIVKRLIYIITCENEEGNGITFEQEAIEYIAKIADGGMRNAISLLDKCISYNPQITTQTVIEALGVVDYSTYFDLTFALLDGNQDAVITLINEFYRNGQDLKQFMKQFTWFLLDVKKYDIFGTFEFIQIPSTYNERMMLFKEEDFLTIPDILKMALNLSNEIKWEANPKAMIEATLLLFMIEHEEEGSV